MSVGHGGTGTPIIAVFWPSRALWRLLRRYAWCPGALV